jgi:hypothetical protein
MIMSALSTRFDGRAPLLICIEDQNNRTRAQPLQTVLVPFRIKGYRQDSFTRLIQGQFIVGGTEAPEIAASGGFSQRKF